MTTRYFRNWKIKYFNTFSWSVAQTTRLVWALNEEYSCDVTEVQPTPQTSFTNFRLCFRTKQKKRQTVITLNVSILILCVRRNDACGFCARLRKWFLQNVSERRKVSEASILNWYAPHLFICKFLDYTICRGGSGMFIPRIRRELLCELRLPWCNR